LEGGQALLPVNDVPRADVFSEDPTFSRDDRAKEVGDFGLAPLNSQGLVLDVLP
jgi:hypothetical protein